MTGGRRPWLRAHGPLVDVLLWGALLAAPVGARAQEGEETSVWQFGMRNVEWEAVERLQEDVREYQEGGAIGAYELRIRTNGTRFDAMVTAEIVDAIRLAELRVLDTAPKTTKDTVAGDAERRSAS